MRSLAVAVPIVFLTALAAASAPLGSGWLGSLLGAAGLAATFALVVIALTAIHVL